MSDRHQPGTLIGIVRNPQLAPGEYKLFAWEGVENNAWEDKDFLKLFEPQGTRLEVRDAVSTKVNLTAIAIKQTGEN